MDNSTEIKEGQTGVAESSPALTLDIKDNELIRVFSKRVRQSKNYWEEELKMKSRRKTLENYWLGKHDLGSLYAYQTPYIDNRIYLQVEAINQRTNQALAEPVITPAQDTDDSREMADNVGMYLKAYAHENRWLDLVRIVTRNLLLNFIGVLKVRWNPQIGPLDDDGKPMGDIDLHVVRPQNFVVDKYARPLTNPPFVAEIIHQPLEDVIERFPKKKQELLDALGLRGVKTQMSNNIGYWEVHFSYFEDGVPAEGIVCFSEEFDLVLDKYRTPDWDWEGHKEDDGTTCYYNLLQAPGKPYSYLTMNSLGRHFIDETGPIEQALPLQDALNKRGRQIIDAANESKGGLMFSQSFITKEDAAKLTGDPEQGVVGTGDVRAGVARVPYVQLPQYVMDDKFDARNEIDNIIGVHSPSRGEVQGTQKPTTVKLLQDADQQTRSDLVMGIDRMMEYVYRYAVHLMRLHYTEEHWLAAEGELGKKVYLDLSQGDIEDGIGIKVEAGSSMPTDKLTQRQEALDLMQMGKIDYITFFERMGFPNPKKQAYKLYLHEHDPAKLYQPTDDTTSANNAIEMLKDGIEPVLPDVLSEEYVKSLNAFVDSDEFKELEPDKQAIGADYLQKVVHLGDIQLAQPQPMPEQGQEGQQTTQNPPAGQPQSRGLINRLLGR